MRLEMHIATIRTPEGAKNVEQGKLALVLLGVDLCFS